MPPTTVSSRLSSIPPNRATGARTRPPRVVAAPKVTGKTVLPMIRASQRPHMTIRKTDEDPPESFSTVRETNGEAPFSCGDHSAGQRWNVGPAVWPSPTGIFINATAWYLRSYISPTASISRCGSPLKETCKPSRSCV